jgi:hypothetical protein
MRHLASVRLPASKGRFDLDPAVVDHVDEYLSAGFGTAGLEDGLWGA